MKGETTMSHKKIQFALVVDGRELATILAALRFHQDENLRLGPDIPDRTIKDIATDSGSLKPLDFTDVSRLCERINTCDEAEQTQGQRIWVSIVTDKRNIIHAAAHYSKSQAQNTILDYLRKHKGYTGRNNLAEARRWTATGHRNLRVGICSVKLPVSIKA
jgi:hypothetical protein